MGCQLTSTDPAQQFQAKTSKGAWLWSTNYENRTKKVQLMFKLSFILLYILYLFGFFVRHFRD